MAIKEDGMKTIELEFQDRGLEGYTAQIEEEDKPGLYLFTVTITDPNGISGVSRGQSENRHLGINVFLYHREIRRCVVDYLDRIESQKKK